MKNVTITWDLPTTRESGFNLDPNDIDFVDVEMSADAGANWSLLDTVQGTDPQTAFVPDLEIGNWQFRFTVQDTAGRRSSPVVEFVNVPDETSPGPVENIVTTMV